MRVIAGTLKGRRLKAPHWQGVRPTSDKLRETLFNIVAARVAGARVLDLFAGTGALGIEALSRGAAHVTFVEADRRATALIQENLAACGVADRYTVERGDAVAVLHRLPPAIRFDLILMDPPYEAPEIARTLEAAAAHLAEDGLLVLERASRRAIADPAPLVRTRDVKSGDSTLTLYRISP